MNTSTLTHTRVTYKDRSKRSSRQPRQPIQPPARPIQPPALADMTKAERQAVIDQLNQELFAQ